MKKELIESTLQRVQELRDAGAIQLRPSELAALLQPLGYAIGDSFCYVNDLNLPSKWAAKSVGIKCKETGHGFANIAARKERLHELQMIRHNYFVFDRNRLWEI